MKNIKIICTLGPSSFKKKTLDSLKKIKVNVFRINLSHTNKSDIKNKILYLRKNKIKNICLDTEGAQLRTTKTKKRYHLKKGTNIKVSNNKTISDNTVINLYPKFNLLSLSRNSKIEVGFSNLKLKVLTKNFKTNYLLCKVIKSGLLESNKGVHLNKNIKLPALTEKDIFALNLGKKMGIKYYAISFVNNHKDINEVKKLVKSRNFIISKIETKKALNDLKKISQSSSALLIDRGDLSRYIPIEEIPIIQEKIIANGKKNNTPVYVATNLLENMIKNNEPTRAESNDVFSTLKQGASGLVLAAETAIGQNPIECVKFLAKSIKVFKKYRKTNS